MALCGIFISSILAIAVISQDNCEYGVFALNSTDLTCQYYCYDFLNSNHYYIDIDALSFDFIMDKCDDIKYANQLDPTSCNSLDDLLWINEPYKCQCPYCKCTTTKSQESSSYYLTGPYMQCTTCNCQLEHISNEMVYECSQYSWSEPTNWDYTSCPPNQCQYTDQYRGDMTAYYGTDDASWLPYNNASCTEFCYCPENGDAVCEIGWDNIMANNGSKYAFIRECGDYYRSGAVKYFSCSFCHK